MNINKKIRFFIEDIIEHKQLVLESGKLITNYLFDINQYELAIEFLKRYTTHDNSKFEKDELLTLSEIQNNDGMINPKSKMNNNIKEIISIY